MRYCIIIVIVIIAREIGPTLRGNVADTILLLPNWRNKYDGLIGHPDSGLGLRQTIVVIIPVRATILYCFVNNAQPVFDATEHSEASHILLRITKLIHIIRAS